MARIDELKAKIEEASKAYGEANPIMSDKEFDQLVNELKTLDPTYVDTVTYDDHVEGFAKAKHDLITGTLAKCKNEEEFAVWFKKHQKDPCIKGGFVMEQKMDGAGIELKYVNGFLVQAVTRGTGFEGDDITENAKKVKGVVIKLKGTYTGSIRGEILMSHSMFNKNYKNKMKNCRNAAAGIMKHLDGAELENLNFVAYDIQEKEILITNEIQKMHFLEDNGMEVPAYKEITTLEEAFAFRTSQYENRDKIEYDIDGVVVKPTLIDYEDLKNRTPKNSCAIKFELDVAVATVIGFDWSQAGKYFSPVALLEPVELNGTTVQRASCSNTKWLAERGIEIGSKVRIVKRGEIIPHIEGLANDD